VIDNRIQGCERALKGPARTPESGPFTASTEEPEICKVDLVLKGSKIVTSY